jgi:2-methylisocitrate lyase-like PEP mutase family enzyme
MPDDRSGLRGLIAGPSPLMAPLVLNPMMARLAEQAGFRALYLGGGSMGYLTCATEANLSLVEMVHAGLEIGAVSPLPLILDGACGWGDPMHMHRTIGMAETAGFAAIEIEDQILPKRAHHHIGIEHIIPTELMVAKIAEAAAARRSRDFLLIGRTNAARTHDLDEALRRGEAYARAGADVLFVLARKPEALRIIAERLPRPLMFMTPSGGLAEAGLSLAELGAMGFTLVVDPSTPLLAMHQALRRSYQAMAAGLPDPALRTGGEAEQARVHETIGLAKLLEIEKRTVER